MGFWNWLEGLGVRILGWFGLSADLARQLIRFFMVGGLAAVTYVAVMAVVVDGFGGRVLLGAFLAFVLATLVSFVGNALWSFGSRLTPAKAAMFFAVNTVGLPQHADRLAARACRGALPADQPYGPDRRAAVQFRRAPPHHLRPSGLSEIAFLPARSAGRWRRLSRVQRGISATEGHGPHRCRGP